MKIQDTSLNIHASCKCMSSILGDPNHSPKLPIQTLFTETRESPDPIMAHEIAKNVKDKEKQCKETRKF